MCAVGQSVDAALVAALSRFAAALEVGIGRRTTAAAQLADAGATVVAIDVDSGAVGESDTIGDGGAVGNIPENVAFVEADVHDLAGEPDPVAALRQRVDGNATVSDADMHADATVPPAFDLVYAVNLPAELQRPTVELAETLDAVCAFTTLGFEEPVVDVERRTVGSDTLYVAGGRGSAGNALDSAGR